jgi:hypothetical protein
MPAPDHREAVADEKEARRGKLADRLLARVDQVGIDLVLIRERPDPSIPFSDWSVTVIPRDIVGDQRRDADAEIERNSRPSARARPAPPSGSDPSL